MADDLRLREAASVGDRAAFAHNCAGFIDWLKVRFADERELVDEFFTCQDFARELRELATVYSPPDGCILLLEAGDTVVGGGAFKRFDADSCELKRIFVAEEARGGGWGFKLTARLVELARAAGYRQARLETHERQVEAVAMYRKLGFRQVEPYQQYPPHMMVGLVPMELRV